MLVCVCVCVRARVRARACVCVHACVRAYVCERACAIVCVMRVHACEPRCCFIKTLESNEIIVCLHKRLQHCRGRDSINKTADTRLIDTGELSYDRQYCDVAWAAFIIK